MSEDPTSLHYKDPVTTGHFNAAKTSTSNFLLKLLTTHRQVKHEACLKSLHIYIYSRWNTFCMLWHTALNHLNKTNVKHHLYITYRLWSCILIIIACESVIDLLRMFEWSDRVWHWRFILQRQDAVDTHSFTVLCPNSHTHCHHGDCRLSSLSLLSRSFHTHPPLHTHTKFRFCKISVTPEMEKLFTEKNKQY